MKLRIQFTPAFSAALIGSLLWFAFWLTAFRPVVIRPQMPARSNAALQPADARTIPSFSAPTLFALPSEQGFSDRFPPDRIARPLHFAPPAQPQYFLEPDSIRKGDPNPAPLYQAVPVSRTELRLPDASETPSVLPGLRLNVSPELQTRADNVSLPNLNAEIPNYARVRLRVEPDGTVSQCFFETPVENNALPAAVRGLRFAPADTHTDGWIEIRYSQKEDI